MPIVVLLVLTGLLVGVGVLTLDKFSDATKTDTGVADEAVALTYAGSNQFTGSLANNDIRAISEFNNKTNNVSIIDDITFTATSGAVVLSNATNHYAAGTYYSSYTYGAETRSSLSITNSSLAIGSISVNWMSLIITISVLAIILGLVLNSFVMGRR